MKPQLEKLERWRIYNKGFESSRGDDYGAFVVPGPCGTDLNIISSGSAWEGSEWEHVSVSTKKRCPNWIEMCYIKNLFWQSEETVMQLHPPRSQYVNHHEFCLHLWRPTHTEIPLPPPELVGPMPSPSKQTVPAPEQCPGHECGIEGQHSTCVCASCGLRKGIAEPWGEVA